MLKQILITAAVLVLAGAAQATPAQESEADALRRAVEEKRAAAIAAYEQEQAEKQQREAKLDEERQAQRARQERENQCQFRPVMADEDIAKCRAIYR